MGDPKKSKKKYDPPSHPWQKERIEEERVLVREYGIKNKRELWKATSRLREFKAQAKRYASVSGSHSERQKGLFLKKLEKLGLIKEGTSLDDVLGLQLKNLLERRLETVVLRKKFASTAKQARQFIVHNHIAINGRKINVPGYMVQKSEEDSIAFAPASSLAKDDNPERANIKAKLEKPRAEKRRPVERRDRGRRR